jgi:DNA-binding SARP family transcriptional activator
VAKTWTSGQEKRGATGNFSQGNQREGSHTGMAALDPAVSPLVIRLLGPFDVRVNGLPLPRLRSRSGLSLLALLVLRHEAAVERDWLAGLLWPERSTSQGLATLRRDLTDLRRALGPEGDRLRSPAQHSLCLQLAGASVDVAAFDALIARGDPPSLEQAAALYQGSLLEGWTAEWVFQERQPREQAYLRALEALAERALAGGDAVAAEGYLRRAVGADPLRESAQRALMQVLAAGGNYAAAMLAYRELRLHREINAEPDAETRALFGQLRAEARRKAGVSKVNGGGPDAVDRDFAGTALPPLSSLRTGAPPRSAVPNNLPRQLTSFIGRESEMAEVKELLSRPLPLPAGPSAPPQGKRI